MSKTIYTHKHHIIPKHMGGTDDPSNIVELTVEQHAHIHKRLYELYGYWQDKMAWLGLSGHIGKEEIIKMIQKRPKSKSHIDKMVKTLSDGRRKGANNAHAKKWILTTPSDEIIEIHGSLHETCKKLNINAPFLVRHLNKRVPYIKWRGGKHGGPGTEAYKIRMNTVGFKLEKVCTNT